MPEKEAYIIVDYDIFYTDTRYDIGMEPGWYFWLLDQHNQIVTDPVGPWDNPDDAMHAGKTAVEVYYDEKRQQDSSKAEAGENKN
jgi:hypothetical protein